MPKKFTCDDDGFTVIGEDDDELVVMAANHLLVVHPEMEISQKDIKEMLEET